ncbi:hypothetical protein SCHPADRAFT_943603 [Schizopora paradoxa]|uniref:DUF6533 domain-containing protein n=1 Tax=Schizopora paradoxa TaxID=27342 RepID=A0A0H2RDA6_9AGAM|nr:hypothetical protein SCHPADRAFT_943603 [Schizopora paradoxa]
MQHPPLPVDPLLDPHEIIEAAAQGFRDANATRYLSGIGLVLLLYDHFLTFDDEVRLVWKARRSFARSAFLFNRYLVACSLIWVAFFMNDWSGPDISNKACRRVYGATALLGITSIALANILVSLRVIDLWGRTLKIKILMSSGLMTCFLTTFTLMAVALTKMLPHVHYDRVVRVCVPSVKEPEYAAAWGTSMVYEVLVLVSVWLNVLDKPRRLDTRLTQVLHRDGFSFFATLTVFRLFNMLAAAIAPPHLMLVGSFFVWAMTTLVLNRSLLNILDASSVPFRHDVYEIPTRF